MFGVSSDEEPLVRSDNLNTAAAAADCRSKRLLRISEDALLKG